MKYLLFSGSDYYPSGGAVDLDDTFEALADAMAAWTPAPYRWAHVAYLDNTHRLRLMAHHGQYQSLEELDGVWDALPSGWRVRREAA